MPFFTRTGRATKEDIPRGRGGLLRTITRWGDYAALGSMMTRPFGMLIWWRMREADDKLAKQELREPNWHGLPEAELTPQQEHEAQREAARDWHHDDQS